MQVADVDSTDRGRVDVGPQDLPAAAFAAIDQVSTRTMAQRDAGYIPAHAGTAG